MPNVHWVVNLFVAKLQKHSRGFLWDNYTRSIYRPCICAYIQCLFEIFGSDPFRSRKASFNISARAIPMDCVYGKAQGLGKTTAGSFLKKTTYIGTNFAPKRQLNVG
jgi:hypothetical protein